MRNLIGLKELRENVNDYIREVSRGRSFIVMRRSRPVFKIAPPDDTNEFWETVVDFTEFYKNGITTRQLLKKLHLIHGKSK